MAYNMFQGYNPQSVTGPMDLYIKRQDAQLAQDKQLERQDRQLDLAERQYADLYAQRQAEEPMKQMKQHFDVAEKMFKFNPQDAINYLNTNVPNMNASINTIITGKGGLKAFNVGMSQKGGKGGSGGGVPSADMTNIIGKDANGNPVMETVEARKTPYTPQELDAFRQSIAILQKFGSRASSDPMVAAHYQRVFKEFVANRQMFSDALGLNEFEMKGVLDLKTEPGSKGKDTFDKNDMSTWNRGQLRTYIEQLGGPDSVEPGVQYAKRLLTDLTQSQAKTDTQTDEGQRAPLPQSFLQDMVNRAVTPKPRLVKVAEDDVSITYRKPDGTTVVAEKENVPPNVKRAQELRNAINRGIEQIPAPAQLYRQVISVPPPSAGGFVPVRPAIPQQPLVQ